MPEQFNGLVEIQATAAAEAVPIAPSSVIGCGVVLGRASVGIRRGVQAQSHCGARER